MAPGKIAPGAQQRAAAGSAFGKPAWRLTAARSVGRARVQRHGRHETRRRREAQAALVSPYAGSLGGSVGLHRLAIRMDFSISCPCGKTTSVTAVQAGSEVRCLCGKLNAVPSLSELRHGAGQARYNLETRGPDQAGSGRASLAFGRRCAKCGLQTSGTLCFVVECEQPWSTGGGFWKHFFLWLLAPVWIWGVLLRDYKSDEVFGRETVVEIPVRMCPDCQAAVRNSPSTRAMTALLHTIPLYHQLLREYPKATIGISGKQR